MPDCTTCGHYKKNHAMINKKHLGICDFRTHFSDRPNIICNCQAYTTDDIDGLSALQQQVSDGKDR